MVVIKRTSALLILILVSASAYAGKCNDDPSVVQDPSWYRLRLSEMKQVQDKLMEIYHERGRSPNAYTDADKLKSRILDAKKLLGSALWKYPTLDQAFTRLSNGIALCPGTGLGCFDTELMKKTYKMTEDAAKDMQAKLDTLKSCDPVAQIPLNEKLVVAKRAKLARINRSIAKLQASADSCQTAGVIGPVQSKIFNELLKANVQTGAQATGQSTAQTANQNGAPSSAQTVSPTSGQANAQTVGQGGGQANAPTVGQNGAPANAQATNQAINQVPAQPTGQTAAVQNPALQNQALPSGKGQVAPAMNASPPLRIPASVNADKPLLIPPPIPAHVPVKPEAVEEKVENPMEFER